MKQKPAQRQLIIFFDGVCGLCNQFVDFIIKRDTTGLFQFTPLQGKTAQELLPPDLTTTLHSVVVADGETFLIRSDAVLRVLTHLGGVWKVSSVLFIIPVVIRDAIYRFIAHRRYRWFGKRTHCRLPTPEERERFLP